MENRMEWFLLLSGSGLGGMIIYLLWHISEQLAAIAQLIAEKRSKGV